MKNLMIDETIDIENLLCSTITSRGFEDACTVELFRMKEQGASYKAMKEFVKMFDEAIEEDWGFELA